jgi:hypothetical protein
MRDDGPNYSRNIVQRRQVVPVVAGLSFVAVSVSSWALLSGLVVGKPGKGGNEVYAGLALSMLLALAGGLIAGALAGLITSRVHRSLWPEHPDEE